MLSINMEDVQKAIESCKSQLIFLGVVLALAVVALIVAAVMKKWRRSTRFMVRTQVGIAALLGIVLTVNMVCMGPMNTMLTLATGEGSISEKNIEQAYQYVDDISAEGMILLENDGLLPLENGSRLNVFGWSSTHPVFGGVGSGAISDQYEIVDLLGGLTQAGFEINEELVDFYNNYKDARPDIGMFAQDWTLPEPNVSAYSQEMIDNAKSFSDTAVVVISRPGGENADLPTDMTAVVDGSWRMQDATTGNAYFNGVYDDTLNEGSDWEEGQHYLELNNREKELLDLVCENFEDVVVVINANNAMELGFLKDYEQIRGAIYAPCPGQSGFTALGKILDGEVNPSGRTVDTFLADLTAAPCYNNWGQFTYDNMEDYAFVSTSWFTGEDQTTLPQFVNYVEGIYVGYKFYETAYAEAEAGNMEFDYDAQVVYPFGYGLSYTQFTQEMSDLQVNGTDISVDVTVTNTGDAAGKDVVELYYNPPYTNGGIEKAAATLVAFDKTELLEPGESQTLTLTIKAEDMASYDESGEGCYVLEAGNYVISIRSDSHTIIAEKIYKQKEEVRYDGSNPRESDETAATNQFADATGDNVIYLSRADGFQNYDEATAAPASLSMSDEYKAAFVYNDNYDPLEHNNDEDEMPVTGAKNNLTLADLRGVDYDDPQWDALLDQLSVQDMDAMIAYGGYSTTAIDSVGKVGTTDCDGPASINNNFTGKSSIGFPGSVLISSTWNTDCSYNFGSSIGQMADEMDVSGWYAPAMNNHRSAFSGRNFEYFSEDGVLAGYMAAGAVQGSADQGVYAYIKHFAFNDQESGRNSEICTWSNEQALREIYLKPFEICVKTMRDAGGAAGGHPLAVMSSFNYIGTQWAGADYGLQTTVLRDEWGFRGMVLTDYYGVYGYMDAAQAIRGGTDICLSPMDTATNHLTDTTSATSVKAARQACKNIMYTIVNSRAYADENLNPGMPDWQKLLVAADVVLVLLAAALEVLIFRGFKKRKNSVKIEVAN